jgi:outer membrane protein OmpA-like peptidoglycan-associated protein
VKQTGEAVPLDLSAACRWQYHRTDVSAVGDPKSARGWICRVSEARTTPAAETISATARLERQDAKRKDADQQVFEGSPRGDGNVVGAFTTACTPTGKEVCYDGIDNDCDGTYDDTCGYAPGSLQWTLVWTGDDDLDLHVVGPDGVEVWAGHKRGGQAGLALDRDCRGKFGPPCEGGNVENIYVDRATRPVEGTYQIWVEVAQTADGVATSSAGGTRKIGVRLAGRLAGKTYSMPLSLLAQSRTRLYWAFAVGRDSDKDGVADKDDACPNEVGRWSLVAAESGCRDTDADGVADKVDACPTEPGIRSSDSKQNGCPKRYGKAKLTASGVEITEAILFATGSAAILPQSYALLHDIGTVIKGEPVRLRKILLEGHTDNMGTPAANVTLSRDRVTSVRDWLGKTEGVSADHMELAWYGQDQPVAENTTDAARARNRRVVFRVIDPPPSAPPSW